MRQRCRRMENQKPWPDFALSQDFVKGKGCKPKVKIENVKIEDVGRQLVLFKQITDGDLDAELPRTGQFFVIFGKKYLF